MEADDELVAELQHRLYSLLAPLYNHPTYFPGGQPVSFTRSHLSTTLPSTDYYVCEKSDGVRYLLFLAQPPGGLAAFLIDRNWRVRVYPGFGLMTRELDIAMLHADTLIDGEFIEGENGNCGSFLMFDCLLVNGVAVWQMELPERLAKLQNHVVAPYQHMLKTIPAFHDFLPFTLHLKQQYKSYGIAELLDQVIPRQRHANDGLVFTPVREAYRAGTWPGLLKWKPAEWNTIDFLVKGEGGKVELWLNRQGRPELYTTSTDPALLGHDGQIVECRLDNSSNKWLFCRVRQDKHHPNDRAVSEKVLASIKVNVTRTDLVGALDEIKRKWKAREHQLQQSQGHNHTLAGAIDRRHEHPHKNGGALLRLEWKSFEEYSDYEPDEGVVDRPEKRSRPNDDELVERDKDGEQTSESPLDYSL
jgi:mRNA guanylyltransferase